MNITLPENMTQLSYENEAQTLFCESDRLELLLNDQDRCDWPDLKYQFNAVDQAIQDLHEHANECDLMHF